MSQNIAVNDIIVVQTVAQDGSQVAVLNRYWFAENTIGPGSVTFTNVADFFDVFNGTNLPPILANTAGYVETRVRRIFPANTDQWGVINSNAAVGTAGAVGLPKQTCGLVKFITADLGHHGSGRSYMPFPAVASNETVGQPTAGYVADVGDWALGFTTDPTTITVGAASLILQPVLWDRAASAKRFITGFQVSTDWATQRRRGAFGRTNRVP